MQTLWVWVLGTVLVVALVCYRVRYATARLHVKTAEAGAVRVCCITPSCSRCMQ
jgi:hypothetical protein